MQVITLYRYSRDGGGVTDSPEKPDCEYTTRYRLIADDGKTLTNGSETTECIDVDSPAGWSEMDKPEPDEPTEPGARVDEPERKSNEDLPV